MVVCTKVGLSRVLILDKNTCRIRTCTLFCMPSELIVLPGWVEHLATWCQSDGYIAQNIETRQKSEILWCQWWDAVLLLDDDVRMYKFLKKTWTQTEMGSCKFRGQENNGELLKTVFVLWSFLSIIMALSSQMLIHSSAHWTVSFKRKPSVNGPLRPCSPDSSDA